MKKRTLQFRKIEYMSAPILIAVVFPFLEKLINHRDISLYSAQYILTVIGGSILGIAIGIWGYRSFYDKPIASAEALLKSIAEFEE
jgi:uncharacterized membrane protein